MLAVFALPINLDDMSGWLLLTLFGSIKPLNGMCLVIICSRELLHVIGKLHVMEVLYLRLYYI
jgi:hypothetical protein